MIDKEEIINYILKADEKTAKNIALVTVAMLKKTQLEVLSKRFKKTYEFVNLTSPQPKPKSEPKPEDDDDDEIDLELEDE